MFLPKAWNICSVWLKKDDVSMLCSVVSSMSPVTVMFFKHDLYKIKFFTSTEFSSKVQLMAETTLPSVDFICYQHFPLGWVSHEIGRQNKAWKWSPNWQYPESTAYVFYICLELSWHQKLYVYFSKNYALFKG